jgi:hypothetical protein
VHYLSGYSQSTDDPGASGLHKPHHSLSSHLAHNTHFFRHWLSQLCLALSNKTRYLQLHDQVQVIRAFINVFQGNDVFMLNPTRSKQANTLGKYKQTRKLENRGHYAKSYQTQFKFLNKALHKLVPQFFPCLLLNFCPFTSAPLHS